MRLTSLTWYLRHPLYPLQALAYRIYLLRHPGQPWIAPSAVEFCNQTLKRDMLGLEWGSGRSTHWFGERLKKLVSVEHDPKWFARISKDLPDKIDYRLIPLEHDVKHSTHSIYEKNPKYVEVAQEFADKSLDFVVIDGHYRQACVLAILKKIRPGGLLLIDNTNWMNLDAWGVPSDWKVVHQGHNFMTETTIWKKPTEKN